MKPDVTPHPVRRVAYLAYLGGGLMLVAGVMAAFAGSVFWLPLGAFFVAYGYWIQNVGKGAQVLNKALNLAASGKLGEAEALLDWGEPAIRRGRLERALAIQRALIAMRRGDVALASTHADAAVTRPTSWLLRRQDQVQRVAALGVRAVLRASSGDAAGAKADAAKVRASADALPESLARATLAEAIVAERAGDFSALRTSIERDRELLSSALRPRERALIRAYQRMLRAPSASVYRSLPARHDAPEAPDEPELVDWIAKIAPAAAGYVPAGTRAAATIITAPAAEPEAIARARARKPNAPRGARRYGLMLGLWAGLVVLFLAVWQFLMPATTLGERGGTPIPEPVPEASFGLFAFVLFGVVLGLSGLVFKRVFDARSGMRKLFAAINAVARGDAAAATALEALAKSPTALVAAQARHQLAVLADRAGKFDQALAHAEAGLGLLASPSLKMASSDFVYPNLASERAFALLAVGRRDDAIAELALVTEQFPSFPFLARATFRISLLDAIRAADYPRAGEIAVAAAELPVSAREELLADVARAVAAPESVGAGELSRIREELRTDASSSAWLRVVAQPLFDTFWRGDAERAEDRDAEAEAEVEAEAEAHALAEAAVLSGALRAR